MSGRDGDEAGRRRLPLANEVVERCRLCDAVLDISVENPRRVCAACGEVNLPTDQGRGGGLALPKLEGTGRAVSWVADGLTERLTSSVRTKWLIHGIAMTVQLAIVLGIAWEIGKPTPHSMIPWQLIVGAAFSGFLTYAFFASMVIAVMRRPWQVALFDLAAPALVAFWLLGGFRNRSTERSPQMEPDPTTPVVSQAMPPPRVAPAPKPAARAAPGWEGSPMLASFSVETSGTGLRLRFTPHFTGTLRVTSANRSIADLTYGRTTCRAVAEEPTECLLLPSRPGGSLSKEFELSASADDDPRRFDGPVTWVTVDATGAGRPRRRGGDWGLPTSP